MRATCALQLRQLSLLLLLLLEPCAGSGPRAAASSRPPPRTRLSGATTAAAGPHGSPSPGVSAAAAAAASRLPPWERESSVPWAPPVSGSTAEPAAGGHTSGPVIGSGYQRLRNSDIEVGTASSLTDNMDTLTTFSRSGERTLLSITNIAMSTTATESTASYTEMIGSADLTQHSSSVEKSRRNISSSDTYFTEPGMEPLIAQSSEIPTYSSSQTDPPAVGSSNQILSTWHMGKKTPTSHTDSMYISPTFSRDGERTLRLLTNSITSTDSLKITTSHTEIALSSDLTNSSASISQTGGSNRSSAITDIPESSTGPLLIHSPSKSDFPAIEGSRQPISSSESEKKFASSHIASMYISTSSTRAGERTLQSLINSSRSSDAKEDATSGAEMSSSSYLTQSSSISSIALTSGINISLDATDFTELSTDPLLTHSPSASETASKAIGSSHQPINSSATEKRTSDLHTTNTYISTTFIRGGERTLRSLTNSSTSPDVADSSTSNLENIMSSDLTQPSSSIAQTGGSNVSSSDFSEPLTESLLTHSSKIPSYSSSPNDLAAIGSSHQPIKRSATEKRTSYLHTTGTYISVAFTRGGERTLRSMTNSNTSPDVMDSSTSYLENTTSSDLTQPSSSVAQAGGSNVSSSDFSEPLTEPLLTHSSKIPSNSSSPNDLAAIGINHQPISVSTTEKRTSDLYTTKTSISTTFTRGGERTLRSLTNSSTSPDVADSSTFYLEKTTSSDLIQLSTSVAQAGGSIVSSRDFTESSVEALLTHSSKIPSSLSSPSGLAAIGSSHQPNSISAREKRTSDLHTTDTYVSTTFTRGGERTLRSLTNSNTSPDVMDSSTSYLENTTSSDLTQPSTSVAQDRGSNVSSGEFSEPLTEPLLTHSSRISSNSSLPNGLAAIGSSHQPNGVSATEKSTSDLHTTNIYISTTFTRGGGTTLRSLTNSSTSPDVTDSSTSYLENTTFSDLTQSSSSVAQDRGRNVSSSEFSEPLPDPLLIQSSKTPGYVSSPSGLEANGSSHQPNTVSATEKKISDLHTTNTYISTAFTRGGGRTLRSLTNSSTTPDVADSSSSYLEKTTSSDLIQLSTSVAQAGGSNVSSRDFMESSVEALLTHSSKIPSSLSSPSGLAGIGSSHQPISISAREKRTSDLHTTDTYVSTTFTRGGERTLRSLTNSSTSPDVTDSSTSYLENTTFSDLTQSSSSVAQDRGRNVSSSEFSEPLPDPLLIQSSKTPGYVSSPSGLEANRSSHQPNTVSATEKRTSDLHTANTYISTPFTRGGGRTLRSLTNSSTSPDVADSSSSFLENTTSSDLIQLSTSVAQAGGSNVSSRDFKESSVEALLTHSSKIPSSLSSPSGLAGIGSSHQPISISAREKRTSDLHTTDTYISTMFTRGGERTLRSLTNSSTSSDVAESFTSYLENTMSSDLTHPLSPVAQAGGNNVSSSDFSEPSTAPLLTHSSSSSNGLAAIGSSYQPISISATEKRTSDLHTTNMYISTTFTRGGGRTLRSLTNSSTSPDVTDSSTSYLENTTSSDLTQPSSSVAQAGGSNISSSNFTEISTEPLLIHFSKIPSSSSPNDLAATQSSHQPDSISATEKRDSDSHITSTYFSTTLTRGGEKTLWSLTSSSTSPDKTENTTSNLENTRSSDLSQPSSSIAQTGGSNITSSDFTEPSTEPSLVHSSKIPTHSSSSNDLAGVRSSHQSVTISDREKRISSTPTHGMYVSTTFTSDGERTSRSQTHSSTSAAATEVSTHNIDVAKSSDSTQFLSSVSQTGGFNVSSSDANFTEPSTESLLTHSSKISTLSSPNDASTIGSNHQSLSSSNTEKRMSSPYTDSMYSSAMLTGDGERMLRSLTNSTSTHATEDSSSDTEITNSSELIQSSSMAQTRGTSISANDMAFTGSSTETFFIHSSKIPTYSSFQNDPSSIASSHQPVSSIDTEKRTSASRTDSMYISTTFNRGGERTLLSISNNSTSAESSESSTFYAEISNSSDLVQSSSFVVQGRGNNITSSDEDLIAPSTEPLLVHSSKMPAYSSTVDVQNTTLFYTGAESTGSSSLSSSAFPSSSSVSSLYRLLSSTPSPPHSFESSESSLPSPSSVIPSSLPPPSLSSSLSTSSSVASSPLLSSLLPPFSSPSSSLQDGDRFQTSMAMVTSEGTHRMELSTAVFYGSTPRQYSNHSRPHQLNESTSFKPTGPLPLQTEPMEQLSSHSSSTSASPLITESSTRGTFTSKGDHFEKTTLLLTTATTSLSKNTQHTEMAKTSTSILPNTTRQKDVELTGKTVTLSTDVTFGPPHSVPTKGHSVTTKTHKIQTAATTSLAYVTGVTTKAMETSTTTSVKITGENIPATHPPKTSASSKTTARFSTTSAAATKPTIVALLSSTKALVTSSHATVNVCSANPCLHDGKCVINGVTGRYQCKCTPAWQGEVCGEDVDECLFNPCPALATCNNTQGSYVCKCPLGYQLEKGKCNLVRTFVGQVPLKLNITHGKYSELRRIEDEIITMLNMSLSTLPGYYNSIVKATRESNSVQVSFQSTFSLASNVTFFDIVSSVRSYGRACKSPAETCQFSSSLTLSHRVGGLCKQKDPECDRETSECTDLDGIAVCQCQSGYFKYNKMDHSCRACEDGYRLENETCVSCPFGLGGFNCRNPYQLITVVIAAAGGGLLLILGIALIITCCRKNKNDISKLIFKSGDFQMSPYAEYPKNPRAQEWARETIEMQENGSTKNLLQMTDVYYSPTGLRNAELERNGLYPPYTGLPGSRHSCIYPGQYNLSFISDETRRRDYF